MKRIIPGAIAGIAVKNRMTAAIVGVLMTTGLLAVAPAPAASAAPSVPNIVIIMTDDQRWDTVTPEYMPRLTNILSQNPSVTYQNSFVPNSLCCPSRTSTLTGDYSHTTGVYDNAGVGQWGGFSGFTAPPEGASVSSVNDSTTLAVDMHNAGYRTGLMGKYVNGYPEFDAGANYTYVPPGWDRWFAVHGGTYYNYYASMNGGKSRFFGAAPRDYMTRVLTRRVLTFIAAPSPNPFFLYYAPTAPHEPAIPDPRDVGRFSLKGYTQPPSFGKAEAGAPTYIKNQVWNLARARSINHFHALQLDSAYGVDRSIGQIWSALPDNTVVLFMSDNGFMWDEHKFRGKQVPYNESLRVPIRIVGKNLQTPLPVTGRDPRIVLNVDVAPTLEGLAGVTSGHPIEGLDMFTSSRDHFVIEHLTLPDQPPTYCGVRSLDWMYVRYTPAEEPVSEGLYHESTDPYELNNLAVTNPSNVDVAAELQTMQGLAANICRVSGGIYPPDWPFH
jgi:N-acetylglucosamine-6-sulfatase